MTPPTAEGGSLRSQDLRTPADPTGLDGSLIRVDPETGQGLPGNPLYASSDENARRIVAYGMRNPFRFTVRPGTNEVWVGDVGQSTWEEIDRVENPTGSTPYNFGWPCYEGANGTSARQPSWEAADVNLCENLYKEGPSAVNAPYYAYKHTEQVVPGETCPTGSSAISGLAFYESGPFPNIYNGALFFEDYERNCIWAMLPGANGLPNPKNIQTFDAGAHTPVDLVVGPDGALYYVDIGEGKIMRIASETVNHPPTAVATATPQEGPGPLKVQLSAAESSDPDPGDTLSYSWDLNGDGKFGDSTEVSPTYTYTEPGTHVATVRVTDPEGASDTASVSIKVNDAPPTATITAPLPSLTWAVGDQIPFSGTATDPQDGTLPASAYSWNIVLHHCASSCDLHQIETVTGKKEGVLRGPRSRISLVDRSPADRHRFRRPDRHQVSGDLPENRFAQPSEPSDIGVRTGPRRRNGHYAHFENRDPGIGKHGHGTRSTDAQRDRIRLWFLVRRRRRIAQRHSRTQSDIDGDLLGHRSPRRSPKPTLSRRPTTTNPRSRAQWAPTSRPESRSMRMHPAPALPRQPGRLHSSPRKV